MCSGGRPAKDITLRGLGFRDARKTYMDPWGVPSGGDWALHRGGARSGTRSFRW